MYKPCTSNPKPTSPKLGGRHPPFGATWGVRGGGSRSAASSNRGLLRAVRNARRHVTAPACGAAAARRGTGRRYAGVGRRQLRGAVCSHWAGRGDAGGCVLTRRGQALFGGQSTCEIRPFNGTFTRANFGPFETEIERTHMGAAAPARGRSALVTAPMPRCAPRSTRPSAPGALRVRACLWLPPQPPFSDAERASRAAGERESASAALLRPACALPTPGALRTSRCPVSPSELGARACCANVPPHLPSPLQLEALATAKRARRAPSAALEARRRAGVGTAPFLSARLASSSSSPCMSSSSMS